MQLSGKGTLVFPSPLGMQDVLGQAWDVAGKLQAKHGHFLELGPGQGAVVDRVQNGASVSQANPVPRPVLSPRPARVQEPCSAGVGVHPLRQHRSILCRVPDDKGLPEAGGECSRRLFDTVFGSSNLSRVPTDEMILGLGACQPRHRGEDAECVACQQDQVLRVPAHAWDLRIWDVLDGVGTARVFRQGIVRVVHDPRDGVQDDIL